MPFSMLGTELRERDGICDDFLRQSQMQRQFFRGFPQEHASWLEAEAPEFRNVVSQIDQHVAPVPRRIKCPRRDADLEHKIATIAVEPAALCHHRKSALDQGMSNGCPLLQEYRRARPYELDDEIKVLIGASRKPGCKRSHIT